MNLPETKRLLRKRKIEEVESSQSPERPHVVEDRLSVLSEPLRKRMKAVACSLARPLLLLCDLVGFEASVLREFVGFNQCAEQQRRNGHVDLPAASTSTFSFTPVRSLDIDSRERTKRAAERPSRTYGSAKQSHLARSVVEQERKCNSAEHVERRWSDERNQANGKARWRTECDSMLHAPTPVSTFVPVGALRNGRKRAAFFVPSRPCENVVSLAEPNPYRPAERDQFRALLRQFTSVDVQLASCNTQVDRSLAARVQRPVSRPPSVHVISSSASSVSLHEDPRPAHFTLETARVEAVAAERRAKVPVDELVALPSDADSLIRLAFYGGAVDEVLVTGYRLRLKRSDVLTLNGLNWLNDEVINFYLQMLVERAARSQTNGVHSRAACRLPKLHAFNTFFYPKLLSGGHESLKRWTKKLDLFDFDLILVPVHLVVHWCLAVVDLRNKAIRYFDSMGNRNPNALHALLNYLEAEHRIKKGVALGIADWRLEHVNVPQQLNGSDCGMFACKFADYVARDAPITFTQKHMPYFRKRMVYELLTKRLLNS